MYGGLSQLHDHVHGNHDAVHEQRQDGHEDDVHVHGLHGNVPDVRQWHDAHVPHVREDVCNVRRDVHGVCDHVREHERQSNDEAVRRNVSAVRWVLLHDGEVGEGRLSRIQQDSGAAHSAPESVRKKSGTFMPGLFANSETQARHLALPVLLPDPSCESYNLRACA
jgi:hypothetical protein